MIYNIITKKDIEFISYMYLVIFCFRLYSSPLKASLMLFILIHLVSKTNYSKKRLLLLIEMLD